VKLASRHLHPIQQLALSLESTTTKNYLASRVVWGIHQTDYWLEVGTADTGLVGKMHNEASVSDESACARNQIGIGVGVGSSVACAVEFAVLAAKIAHLACRWCGGVA